MKGALTRAEERPFSPFSGSLHRSVALRFVARLNLPVLRCDSDSGTFCMKASISRRRAHSPSRGALTLKLRQAGRTLPLPLPLRGGRGGESESWRAVLHGKRSFSTTWLSLVFNLRKRQNSKKNMNATFGI